jgi:hypothetical protein
MATGGCGSGSIGVCPGVMMMWFPMAAIGWVVVIVSIWLLFIYQGV